MSMELVMVNPYCEYRNDKQYGIEEYVLVFDGFEGLGNVDEDGDEFYYYCTLWKDKTLSDDWVFCAERMYEDDHTPAWFTKVEAGFVKKYMENVRDGGGC